MYTYRSHRSLGGGPRLYCSSFSARFVSSQLSNLTILLQPAGTLPGRATVTVSMTRYGRSVLVPTQNGRLSLLRG